MSVNGDILIWGSNEYILKIDFRDRMGAAMEFQSILFADSGQKAGKSVPAFFEDLRLDYIMKIIENQAKGYSVRLFYYTLPGSVPLIGYRQQVCKDLSDGALRACIRRFCAAMQKFRSSHTYSTQCEEEVQAASYHLEAASLYWDGLTAFERELGSCSPSSEGVLALAEYLKEHIASLRKQQFEQALARAGEFFSQMRFRLAIGPERIVIEEETEEVGNYLEELTEILGAGDEGEINSLSGIFPNALEPSYLEETLISLLKKSNPDIFHEIRGFKQEFPDFYSEKLLRFEEEVQFYISFLEFAEKTEAFGYPMALPEVLGDGGFSGTGVYDIALLWKSAGRAYSVISNNFDWSLRPSFFVVTGPNQGGKTTFARSMGQAVYFAMMGLPINASSLKLPFFEGIATHFEAEEKIQSNSGKLKEEINRLAPMMHQDKKRQFVILNELFTTATTYDALIMGKKVMGHFLKRECYGIYVTHIQELAEETDSVTSLVAQVEDGEGFKRTYRILPMKAQGYGYSDSLVKQFELSYEDIIRRLP